ncbi:MAG: signal peptidase I [Acidimicrobiia bacterium]
MTGADPAWSATAAPQPGWHGSVGLTSPASTLAEQGLPTVVEPTDQHPDAAPAHAHERGRGRARPKGGRHAQRDPRAGMGGFLRELPFLIIIGFGIVVLAKAFLVQAFYIPSGSMEETLHVNDRVLVNRQAYLFGGPQRGDVVVFRNWDDVGADVPPPSAIQYVGRSLREGIGLGSGGKQDLIKRVVGLPGDTVEVRDSRAVVNGLRLEEPYVFIDGPDPLANMPPEVVPEGHYLVLGDHRNNSADSRAGGVRFVDEDVIVGRAFLRIWPLGRVGGLGGPPTTAG